jgi:hypothetical protein
MDRWQNFVHWRLCGLVVLLVASLVEPAKAELPSMIQRKILFSDPQRAAIRISFTQTKAMDSRVQKTTSILPVAQKNFYMKPSAAASNRGKKCRELPAS